MDESRRPQKPRPTGRTPGVGREVAAHARIGEPGEPARAPLPDGREVPHLRGIDRRCLRRLGERRALVELGIDACRLGDLRRLLRRRGFARSVVLGS